MRVASQEPPILANERNRTALAQRYGSKIALKIVHFHCAEDEAEKLAVWPRHSAHKMDGPRSGRAVEHGLAEIIRQLRVRLENLEKVAIGYVNLWQRPEPREVD